jgi:Zn-dependent M32 family carboxypeptidase
MGTLNKILDKLLTSLLTSVILFFFSFSFMTGKFPPQKDDMQKAFSLIRQMVSTTKENNDYAKSLQGQAPNLEQIIQIQKLALKRSEVTLEFSQLMARFPKGVPSAEIAEKLNQVSEHLAKTDEALNSIHTDMQKLTKTEGP